MPEALQQLSIWLIPGCPLLAAILVAAFGKRLFQCGGHRVVVAALVISCGLSLIRLWDVAVTASRHPAAESAQATEPPAAHVQQNIPVATGYDWLDVGGFHVRTDLEVDSLTAVMLAMVTFVSLLVAIYASGYMHGDPGYSRFFAELSLFVFSMCMLVLARNFVVLFVFWEGVGLCSYLLIGFWFQRPTASAAALKAFLMNRIGDAAFLVAIFLIWRTFGSLDFAEVFRAAASHAPSAEFSRVVLTICLCLFLGACGKSAQFPLHLWLPDAMEGPTPVSALIHAATMVTAGVYMVARATPLFVLAPEAQLVVASIGGFTALLSALIALTQTDLKRILAYSTISQLGYMFLALGSAAAGTSLAAAAVTAAIFHMFTHAFFKALLFLSAGNVMHAMGNVIDVRRFRGLKRVMPVTHLTFLCGAAALAGFPFLSGFWSKDEILGLLAAGAAHGPYTQLFKALFYVGVFTAILTAFYTFRAYFLTFQGPLKIPAEAFAHAAQSHHAPGDAPRAALGDSHGHQILPLHHDGLPTEAAGEPEHDPSQIHEGSSAMKWPLVVLSVFALAIGLIVGPTHLFAGWIELVPFPRGEALAFQWGLALASTVAALAGIAVAAILYARPNRLPERIAFVLGPLYRLSLNKFYLDELANVLVVFPVNVLAFLSLTGDQGLIDRLVDWLGELPGSVGKFLRPVQNGLIQSYALVMLFGLAIFLVAILQIMRVP